MKLTENHVKTIKVNYSDLLHRTSTIDFFSVSFKYKSNGDVLLFQFNVAENRMEVTFHNLISKIEIQNLKLNDNLSQLIFDVSVTSFKTNCLIASTPIEMAIFKVINMLYNKGLPKPIAEQEFNYDSIRCRTKFGKLEMISVDNLQLPQNNTTETTQISSYDFIVEMMKEIVKNKEL